MKRMLLAALVAVFATSAMVEPTPAKAQNSDLLSALGSLVQGQRDRKSDEEIEREARDRALSQALSGGEISPGAIVGGFVTYREEKRRLEEEERRRRDEDRDRVLRVLLGGLGG
ncbi:MAG: hypothetical protein AAFU68_00420 [Pseudomonadota bacterium]